MLETGYRSFKENQYSSSSSLHGFAYKNVNFNRTLVHKRLGKKTATKQKYLSYPKGKLLKKGDFLSPQISCQ